ncbi:MAG: diguanylate cyclase [Chitinivibrionales bacterium]|nr:diguanylate cyclase [Chitinivibrionales bacterium]
MQEEINSRYQIIQTLGSGGMGEVYLAKDRVYNGQLVALKLIKEALVKPALIATFKKEFEVMSRLKHPNLVHVYDFGIDRQKATYYLTMEYVEGKLLSEALKAGNFDLDGAIELFVALCRAVEFIHSRNIVHRDIKPGNIMLHRAGVAKLMDFGLADLEGGEKRHKGTLFYLAPEVLGGIVTPRVDLYALGITFCEILCGRKNFSQIDSSEELLTYLNDQQKHAEYAEMLLEGIADQRLAKVIGKMICFEERERYRYASEIIDDINTLCNRDFHIETEQSRQSYVLGAGFVGREQELGRLKQVVTQEQTHAALVYGVAGIGKSRLMAELKKYCQLNEAIFIEASCFETVQKLYSPFIAILNECLYCCSDQSLCHYGPELKKLLPGHEKLSHIQENARADAKSEQRMLSKYISDFLLDVAIQTKSQLILYLNDVQWIDEASAEIVEKLLFKLHRNHEGAGQKLKVYLSCRTEGLAAVAGLREKPYLECIELEPFDRLKVESFFEAVFGAQKVGENLRRSMEHILSQVGGNPFYLQEVIRSLVSSDVITAGRYCWELVGKIQDITIPQDLSQLLLNRYRRLQFNPEERMVLAVLSLLDRQIGYTELCAIVPTELTLLQRLDYVEIVNKEIVEGELCFHIAHSLIQAMIIAEIVNPQAIHGLIAERLEQIHRHDRQEHLYALAHHYFHSSNLEKAQEYLELALEKAMKNYEIVRASELCDRLIHLCGTDDKRKLSFLLKKLVCSRDIVKIDELAALCAEVIASADAQSDVHSRGKCNLILGRAYLNIYERLHAIEHLEKALVDLKTCDDKNDIAQALNDLGVYYYQSYNFSKAIEYHSESLRVAEQIGDDMVAAFAIGNIGNIQVSLGQFQEALNSTKKALAILSKINNKRSISVLMQYAARIYSKLGNNNVAVECIDKALAISEEIESYGDYVLNLHCKSEILFSMGKLEEAQRLVMQVQRQSEEFKIGREFYVFSKLVEAKIEHGKNNDARAIALLTLLSQEITDDLYTAHVKFELWKITKDPALHRETLSLCRKLYTDTSLFEFKEYVEELQREEEPHDTAPVSSCAQTDSETAIFERLKQELNSIQAIFQQNSFSSQIHLKETNALIHERLIAIVTRFQHLSPAVASVDSYAHEQKRIDFFQKLLVIIHDLNSNLPLNTLLEKVLDASLFLMEAQRGFVYLQNKEGALEIKAARRNDGERIDTAHVKISQTIIQRVYEEQKPLFIPNVADELDLSQCQSVIDLKLRSVMCAPLGRRYSDVVLERRKYPFLTNAQKLGIIYIDSTFEAKTDTFIGSNLTLFQALVDQASVAIINTMLYENVNIDTLTGLYLRSYFEQILEQELRYCGQIGSHLSVLMIDIDFFKLINDRFGHQTGDEVLAAMGALLKTTLRLTDICGRYGGEEFILILPNTNLQQAAFVGRKLMQRIRQTTFASGPLTVSIGISSFPQHWQGEFTKDETRKQIIRNADQALYQAKEGGRDRLEVWSEELLSSQPARSSVKDILTGNPIRDYRNVEMLLGVISAIAANITQEDLLARIIDKVIRSLDADRGMILLAEKETGKLLVFLVRGKQGESEKSPLRYSRKTADAVLRTGRDICINAFEEAIETESMMDMELKSIMCVALHQQTERIGVMYIDSKKQIKEFSATELSFCTAIATQVSLLIQLLSQTLIEKTSSDVQR